MAEFYGLEFRVTKGGKKDHPVVHMFESKRLRDLWVGRAPITHTTHKVLREACSKAEALVKSDSTDERFTGVRHRSL